MSERQFGWDFPATGQVTVVHLGATMRIVESMAMIEPGPMEVRVRPWTERLFGSPWRPFQATKLVPTVRPRRDILRVGGMFIMHPEMARQVRADVELHG